MFITPHDQLPIHQNYNDWRENQQVEDVQLDLEVYRGNTAAEILNIPNIVAFPYFCKSPTFCLDGEHYRVESAYLGSTIEEANDNLGGFLMRTRYTPVLYRVAQKILSDSERMDYVPKGKFGIFVRMAVI